MLLIKIFSTLFERERERESVCECVSKFNLDICVKNYDVPFPRIFYLVQRPLKFPLLLIIYSTHTT